MKINVITSAALEDGASETDLNTDIFIFLSFNVRNLLYSEAFKLPCGNYIRLIFRHSPTYL